MKELTIEEKAKLYDEAKDRMSRAFNDNRCSIDFRNEIFPELAESKDEKIRKELIDYFKENNAALAFKGISNECVIAWLEEQGQHKKFRDSIQIGDKVTRNEDGVLVNLSRLNRVAKKQSEQKPTDNVEPKFHEGDWITNGDYTWKIVEVKPLDYILQSQDGNIVDDTISHVDEQFHSFTIQDAKDGDVLACNEEILLFKSYSVQGRISLYCWYNGQTNNFHNKEVVDTSLTKRNKICPATKEQRDALMKAMANAGYTFDFDKKELKKIEQKPIESSREELDELEKEIVRLSTLNLDADKDLKEISLWKTYFLSLSHKQKSVEWSKEDEDAINMAVIALEDMYSENEPETTYAGFSLPFDKAASILKSLRPQSHWKPSDEQMKALSIAMCGVNDTLFSLYQDLKKLREGKYA